MRVAGQQVQDSAGPLALDLVFETEAGRDPDHGIVFQAEFCSRHLRRLVRTLYSPGVKHRRWRGKVGAPGFPSGKRGIARQPDIHGRDRRHGIDADANDWAHSVQCRREGRIQPDQQHDIGIEARHYRHQLAPASRQTEAAVADGHAYAGG